MVELFAIGCRGEVGTACAMAAISCAQYALNSDGRHKITLDQAVQVMYQTGLDLSAKYRETAQGGLAKSYIERFGA